MTREFQQMLTLAAMGATGHSIRFEYTDISWEKVIAEAKKQRVDCFLANALKNNPSLSCPPEIRAPFLQDARKIIFSNALHKSAIIQLLEKMESAGIHGVLLKGYAIADCFALPESRMCGDADIWIDPKDEEKACEFMKKHGFTVEPRWKNGHHAVCNHPVLGCVELHVILYDEIVEDVWFGKTDGSEFVVQPHLLVENADGRYYTLGYTDHFVFLALHMIKHFIISGLTVQMMLDVGLYFKKHIEKIDLERFHKTIADLHYDKLLNCILWAMIKYCGFQKDDFPGVCGEEPAQVDAILTDLEEGGWMGFENKRAREEGWQEYNRQIMLKKKGKLSYLWYMIVWKMGLFGTMLFPPAEKLRKRYPYAQKHPVLLPVAWLDRLIFRGSRAVKNGVLTDYVILNEDKINASAKDRIRLFRELEMY